MKTTERVTELFQDHRSELGFVNRAQVREGDVVHHSQDGKVVGACLYNHCVRKPQTTVYEIAVAEGYRRQGIASELINELIHESPHNKIVAKCPEDLAATEFYRSTGWRHTTTEDGKNRDLEVWVKQI